MLNRIPFQIKFHSTDILTHICSWTVFQPPCSDYPERAVHGAENMRRLVACLHELHIACSKNSYK